MRSSIRAVRTAVVVLAVAGLALDACNDDVAEPGSSQDEAPDEATVTEDADQEPEPDESDGSQPDDPEDMQEAQAGDEAAEPLSGGTDPVADADLPGQDAAMYLSEQGQSVHVVGVDHTEMLLVRGLPDPSAVEVGQLEPMAEVTLAGRERRAGDGEDAVRWVEVELSDGVGWVDSHHLGYIELLGGWESLSDYDGYDTHPEPIGVVSEIAQARADQLTGADQPQVEAVLTDGRDGTQLAQARAVQDSMIDGVHARGAQPATDAGVLQVQPALGGPDPDNLWTIDFLGVADDAVRGERVELFVVDGGGGYDVVGAWTWNICGRGVTEDGSCV